MSAREDGPAAERPRPLAVSAAHAVSAEPGVIGNYGRPPAYSPYEAPRLPRETARPAPRELPVHPLSSRILDGPAALAAVAVHWPQLYANDPYATPYQSPEWARYWAGLLREPDRPVAVLVSGRHGPVAGLALGEHSTPHGRQLAPGGDSVAEVTRPVGPAAEDPDAVRELVRALDQLTHGRAVELPGIPSGSALASELAGRVGWSAPERRPYASVSLPIDYQAMSPATQHAHARRRRAWDGVTGVRYERTRTAAELTRAWDVLVVLHQQRHGAVPDPRIRDLVSDVGPDGATIATLAVRTRYVAAQLLLTRRDRAWSLAIGLASVDPWRALAPGHQLVRLVADDLAACGYTRLTLGRPHTPGQISERAQYRPIWSRLITVERADQLRFDPYDEFGTWTDFPEFGAVV